MLIIRTPQLRALADDRVARLVDDLSRRVTRSWPTMADTPGLEGIRDIVAQCVERCHQAGFNSRQAVERAADGLFKQGEHLQADRELALNAMLAELEAAALLSLLETVGDSGSR